MCGWACDARSVCRARALGPGPATGAAGNTNGVPGDPQPAAESSIAPVPEIDDQLARLTLGAVDVLPAGLLAQQLGGDRPLRIKLGIDPTAPDIHLGHVVVLEKLRQFQAAGHTAVLIIGDYTARVGDPSGRSALRPDLDDAQIDANARSFQEQAFKVLDPDATEVRFNSEWLAMPSGELFGLTKRFTVARLLERDDFAKRMSAGKPISALEMIYPILQGYDSVAVEADLELGATEQKFNLLFGRDVQESFGQRPQGILTMPILPGTDGVLKMSKSTGNYVGVTDPPDQMFGKLMSIPDEVMASYSTLLLGEPLEDHAPPVALKRSLAGRLVDRFHPSGAGAAAEARFDEVHVRHEVPADVPTHSLEAPAGPVHLPALLASAFSISSSEARRLLRQGAVKVDGEAIAPGVLELDSAELSGTVLQVGRRRFARLSSSS